MNTFARNVARAARRLAVAAGALALLGAGGPAWAVQPTAKTVPWVPANPLIPHDIFNGESTRLKGAADVQGGNFQWTWDFGDGSPSVGGTVTNQNVIEASHTYTGSVGSVFTAQLTVCDTDTAECDTANYYLQVQPKNLETEVNRAIDEGLWYLHKTRIDTSCSGLPCSNWPNVNYANYGPNLTAVTASTVNAFEANGHLQTGSASNPYTDTVRRGMRYMLDTLVSENLTNQTYPAPTGTVNPDSNGNGIGIRAPGGSRYPYVSGQVMNALVTSGTQTATAEAGPVNVLGRTYKDLVQDLADSYAWGQNNANSAARGGWRYSWEEYPDNSAAQWAAIGMIPAERFWGITVPPWVKTENLNNWLNYSQYYTGYAPSAYYYGAFGYTGKGTGLATSASGMVQLAFDGVPTSDGRWQAGEIYLMRNFPSFTSGGLDTYSMFSFTKAMREANPPVVNLCDTGSACDTYGDPIDWYGHPTLGFARNLVDRQLATGAWPTDKSRSYINAPLSTPWSILMLTPTLFQAGSPVAVIEATPNPAVAGQVITLDGSGSFHQDPTFVIDSWDWDLDNDGACDDASGPVASISFPVVDDYPVTLCVTDNDSPEKTDTTTVIVQVSTPPLAPTADADGPYVFCPQAQPWYMDGTGSINPDDGQSEPGLPGDFIQVYEWDLDGDGQFDDATGAQPDVTAYFTAQGIGDYLVQLRVTDNTAVSFPSSGLGDLSDTDSAQVFVKAASDPACACVDDLAARPKDGKVQLTWTAIGAPSYNVYRATTSGGPYVFLANTTSQYSTYLDEDVTNGTTYYYVVRALTATGQEACQSNEASATPVVRVRRR